MKMKALKIALFLMPLLLLSGCGTLKKNTESENTKVIYIETEKIVLDTVTVEVPVEVTMTYSGLRDTLKMETSIARAEAYIDENEMQLVGSIENKPAQIEKVVPLKYKTITRDSLIFKTKEIPVHYEVIKTKIPKWCWWLLIINIAVIVIVILKFLINFKAAKIEL